LTQLAPNLAIQRFQENEERMDKWINVIGGYDTNETFPRHVESISDVMARLGWLTSAHTTASLAANTTEEYEATITKISSLLSVVTTTPAWVRVYPTQAAMVADRTRLITEDPEPSDMCVLDVSTAVGALTVNCNPIVIFCNFDSPIVNKAYVSVTNIDTVSRAITNTIGYVGGAI